MTAAKHTPGPWFAEWYLPDGTPLRLTPGLPVPDKATNVIRAGFINARYRPGVAQHVTNEADARLIAAAPDLLEACLVLAQWAQAGQSFMYPPGSLQQITSAIAKATGEQA